METRNLEHYIMLGLEEFQTLAYYHKTNHDLFLSQLRKVDSLIFHMKYRYGYTPEYLEEFNRIHDEYFGEMTVKIRKPEFKLILN